MTTYATPLPTSVLIKSMMGDRSVCHPEVAEAELDRRFPVEAAPVDRRSLDCFENCQVGDEVETRAHPTHADWRRCRILAIKPAYGSQRFVFTDGSFGAENASCIRWPAPAAEAPEPMSEIDQVRADARRYPSVGLTNLIAEIDAKDAEIASLQRVNTVLRGEVDDLRETIAAHEKTIAELQAGIKQRDIDMQREERAHLRTIDQRDQWEEAVADIAAALGCEQDTSNIHDHRQCAIEAIAAKDAEIGQLRTRIKSTDAHVDFVTAERERFAAQREEWRETAIAKDAEIARLTGDVSDLGSRLRTLDKQNDRQAETIASLRSDVSVQQEQLERADEIIAAHEKTIRFRETTARELIAQRDAHEKTIAELRANASNLDAIKGRDAQTIAAHEKTIADLRAYLADEQEAGKRVIADLRRKSDLADTAIEELRAREDMDQKTIADLRRDFDGSEACSRVLLDGRDREIADLRAALETERVKVADVERRVGLRDAAYVIVRARLGADNNEPLLHAVKRVVRERDEARRAAADLECGTAAASGVTSLRRAVSDIACSLGVTADVVRTVDVTPAILAAIEALFRERDEARAHGALAVVELRRIAEGSGFPFDVPRQGMADAILARREDLKTSRAEALANVSESSNRLLALARLVGVEMAPGEGVYQASDRAKVAIEALKSRALVVPSSVLERHPLPWCVSGSMLLDAKDHGIGCAYYTRSQPFLAAIVTAANGLVNGTVAR